MAISIFAHPKRVRSVLHHLPDRIRLTICTNEKQQQQIIVCSPFFFAGQVLFYACSVYELLMCVLECGRYEYGGTIKK